VRAGKTAGTLDMTIQPVPKGDSKSGSSTTLTGVAGLTKVVVYGAAGADQLTVDTKLTTPVELHGGAGDDTLQGGGGGDILFGEHGNDTLAGNSGHDVLVGGHGNDGLNGGRGNDVLLGGSGLDRLKGDDDWDLLFGGLSRLESDAVGLNGLRAVWVPVLGTTLDATILTLRAGVLATGLVFNDFMRDEATGGKGGDWFLVDRDSRGVDNDLIEDAKSEDRTTAL